MQAMQELQQLHQHCYYSATSMISGIEVPVLRRKECRVHAYTSLPGLLFASPAAGAHRHHLSFALVVAANQPPCTAIRVEARLLQLQHALQTQCLLLQELLHQHSHQWLMLRGMSVHCFFNVTAPCAAGKAAAPAGTGLPGRPGGVPAAECRAAAVRPPPGAHVSATWSWAAVPGCHLHTWAVAHSEGLMHSVTCRIY